MSVRFWKILLLFVFIELSIVWLGWWQHGVTLAALQTITRFSGRLSLLLFSFIFLMYQKPPIINAWLSDKYYLLFAIVHGIHLIELVSFVTLSGAELIPYRVAGGALAYLFIFIMPLLYFYYTTG